MDTRQKLDHWQTLSTLSSEDLRDIQTALFELLRSASRLFFAAANFGAWTKDAKPQAEEFVKLLLPQPENSDVATRLKIDFKRQEMSDRISYLISNIGDLMNKHAGGMKVNLESLCDELEKITCPLDNQTIFLQYLYNHLTDDNWQKLSSCLNQKSARGRRWKLLSLEYLQCQCLGEADYAVYETMYNSLTEQVSVACNTVSGRINGKISPLSFRNMLKPHISIKPKAEGKIGMWATFCMIRNVINGKSNDQQTKDAALHNFSTLELYHE